MTKTGLTPVGRRAFMEGLLTLAGLGALPGAALAGSSPAPQDEPALARAQAKFAFGLIGAAASRAPDTAVIVSPASAAGALAVLSFGAQEELRQSICKTLGFEPGAGARLLHALARATSQPGDGPLRIANALMIDPAVSPKKDVHWRMRRSGIKIFDTLAFGKPEAAGTVNGWVSERTNGRIPKMFDVLPEDAGLIALNALYFKDRWKQPFDPAKTGDTPFHLRGGGEIQTKMMHSGPGYFLFRSQKRFIAASLPFAAGSYALTLVAAAGDPAAPQDFEPVQDWLSGEGFAPAMGQVSFPRLDLSSGGDIKPALNSLGLLDEGLTGFSEKPLRLSAALQQVVFAAGEEGVEAAASTGISASRSIDAPLLSLEADRPFLFALRGLNSGLILAAGYVARP